MKSTSVSVVLLSLLLLVGISRRLEAASLPTQDAGIYRLAEWMRADDCRALHCDLFPAFARALSDCKAHPVITNSYTGCKFLIPAGEFFLKSPVVFEKQCIVEGVSGTWWGAMTVIYPSPGMIAFKTEMGGSELRDFALEYPKPKTGTSTIGIQPTVGIDVAGRVSVERIWIRGPTVGILVGNSNVARLRDLVVDSTEFAGIIVGPPGENYNANANLLESVSVVGHCRRGNRWAGHFKRPPDVFGKRACAGIIERGFLGNTHIAHHTASGVDLEVLEKGNEQASKIADPVSRAMAIEVARHEAERPGYDFDGTSNKVAALGLYAEENQPPSYLGGAAAVIGGVAQYTGPGFFLSGNEASSLVVKNDIDPANQTRLRIGAASGGAGVFLEFRANAIDKSGGWRVESDVAAKALKITFKGVNSTRSRIYATGVVECHP